MRQKPAAEWLRRCLPAAPSAGAGWSASRPRTAAYRAPGSPGCACFPRARRRRSRASGVLRPEHQPLDEALVGFGEDRRFAIDLRADVRTAPASPPVRCSSACRPGDDPLPEPPRFRSDAAWPAAPPIIAWRAISRGAAAWLALLGGRRWTQRVIGRHAERRARVDGELVGRPLHADPQILLEPLAAAGQQHCRR